MNCQHKNQGSLARGIATGFKTSSRLVGAVLALLSVLAGANGSLYGQVAIHGDMIYTMAASPIQDAIIVIKDGKIAAIGKAADINVPEGFEILKASVVTPGLIDAHTTVGFSGMLNLDADQDQLESSDAIQPELRAIDAYNSRERLIQWVRNYGVTTIHSGHSPGALISGQTLIAKTVGNTVEAAVLNPARAISVTLSSAARGKNKKSPGTRGKMVSMLRTEFIKAAEYARKRDAESKQPTGEAEDAGESTDDQGDGAGADPKPPHERNLRLETLASVLAGDIAMMITADRAQDIASALRLAKEFDIKIWLDSATEAYLLIDEIRDAGVPVLIHPTMKRANGETENLSFETASKLIDAGIPVALQSGHEAYVPKTRVILFEAGMAAANGLSFEQTLKTITIDAAKILGIDQRVGSLEIGKDGDVALFDGDPFEYTSHCVGVVIDGQVVSRESH